MTHKTPPQPTYDAPSGDHHGPSGSTGDNCCELHSLNGAQQRNQPADAIAIPTILPVGAVLDCDFEGRSIVAVGSSPSGLVAIIDPRDWAILKKWKLDRLSVSSFGVHASGKGKGPRPLVGRFLTNAAITHVVLYRNGNLFDLRRSNLAVVPRSLVIWANRPEPTAQELAADVKLRDGRTRARRKRPKPSARERLAAQLRDDPLTPRNPG